MQIKTDLYNYELDKLLTFLHDTYSSNSLKEKERYNRLDWTNGKYYVSNRGNILSLCRSIAIILNPYIGTDGYQYIDLYYNGTQNRWRVNRLVALSFCYDKLYDIDFSMLEAHHIDGNKLNNDVSNIVLLTPEQHRLAHKILRDKKKEHIQDG